MSALTFVLLGLLVGVGAFVQRIAGFGLAVVAAPFVVTFAPDVMPAALLVVVLPLPVTEMLRNWREILWRPFAWATAGRALTMPLGVWVVAHASSEMISVGVAFMVLVAVAGSLTRLRVRAGWATSFAAGLMTGVSATAASIGGPFFSLALQEEQPQQARSTMAPFFLVGSLVSLAGLAVGGQIPHAAWTTGLGWLPFMASGALLAQPLRRRVDQERFKRIVFTLATVSALGVLLRVVVSS
jgi:uncharacterized membrane protein YfcA